MRTHSGVNCPIEHDNTVMGRGGIPFADDAVDLGQLFHQFLAGLQPAGGINDDNINAGTVRASRALIATAAASLPSSPVMTVVPVRWPQT